MNQQEVDEIINILDNLEEYGIENIDPFYNAQTECPNRKMIPNISLKKYQLNPENIFRRLSSLRLLKDHNFEEKFPDLIVLARELTGEDFVGKMKIEYYNGTKFSVRERLFIPRCKKNCGIAVMFMFGNTKQCCIFNSPENTINIPAGFKNKDILIVRNVTGWKYKILKDSVNPNEKSFIIRIF